MARYFQLEALHVGSGCRNPFLLVELQAIQCNAQFSLVLIWLLAGEHYPQHTKLHATSPESLSSLYEYLPQANLAMQYYAPLTANLTFLEPPQHQFHPTRSIAWPLNLCTAHYRTVDLNSISMPEIAINLHSRIVLMNLTSLSVSFPASSPSIQWVADCCLHVFICTKPGICPCRRGGM